MFGRTLPHVLNNNTKPLTKCIESHRRFSSFTNRFSIESQNRINSSSSSNVWNYLSKRYISPGSGYHELSQSAWKENRFFRYYKFSNKVDAVRQQRGHAAALFTLFLYIFTGYAFLLTSIPSSNKYRHYRRNRDAMYRKYEGLNAEMKQDKKDAFLLKSEIKRREQSLATQELTRQDFLKNETSMKARKDGRSFYHRSTSNDVPFDRHDFLLANNNIDQLDNKVAALQRYCADKGMDVSLYAMTHTR